MACCTLAEKQEKEALRDSLQDQIGAKYQQIQGLYNDISALSSQISTLNSWLAQCTDPSQ